MNLRVKLFEVMLVIHVSAFFSIEDLPPLYRLS